MAKRNYKMKQGRARRAAKSWTKGSRYRDVDDEFVPTRAVPIKPRSKELRQSEPEAISDAPTGRVVDSSGRAWIVELELAPQHFVHFECTPSRTIITAEEGATLVAVGDLVSIKPDEVTETGASSAGGPTNDTADTNQSQAPSDESPDNLFDNPPITAPEQHKPTKTEPDEDQSGSNSESEERLPTGVILQVHPRTRRLSRKTAGRYDEEHVLAANVDQLVILASVGSPWYNKRLIDRYLVSAYRGELDPIIVINKLDLLPEEDAELIFEDLSSYEDTLELPLLFVSCLENDGLDELRELLVGHTSVFSGPSGVGKSSIINTLLGHDIQETRFVNRRTNKGMHTTTFSRMFRLPDGGFVVDTPGIREFGIWDVTRKELPDTFPDFFPFAENCRFNTCSHTHEPDCGVKDAVEKEELDPERYVSYLYILESLPE